MSPEKQLENYAQSIYLVIKNRYFDDIDQEDGQRYIDQVIDWTNMYLDELRTTTNPSTGELVDWWFNRQTEQTLGTATTGTASITLNSRIERLITDEQRYVQIKQDGTTVSNWAVVHPKDITSRSNRITEDMCAMVGNGIVFSRAFRDTEQGGVIVGDVVSELPELSRTNVKLLSQVKPQLLLKLGVAKNATLPDIVQGKLSPSYVQKYQDLLTGAIARSMATSQPATAERDSFGYVRGV